MTDFTYLTKEYFAAHTLEQNIAWLDTLVTVSNAIEIKVPGDRDQQERVDSAVRICSKKIHLIADDADVRIPADLDEARDRLAILAIRAQYSRDMTNIHRLIELVEAAE
ncbi:hypothetical protein [Devosia sp. 63-57]|uniref:hypothetical protein n=1 Tax=Devosia sp. 63-57 TaxID=1895751 RepID=UPI00086E121F|nr:hypothetical protein [Devosia sp. 63-57]ODT47078.1 MAG: hypothetical protein ABS74_12240 [Pelagibacterium sp. SCN 63-126]ODU88895.1 MAG: hypothetical protein ABT14_01115 [Pelagibacterium sp. SCN 63-17]OJX43211.1 MAG: hypothetical protein BGO80_17630 [Devosia sp. 63-57]